MCLQAAADQAEAECRGDLEEVEGQLAELEAPSLSVGKAGIRALALMLAKELEPNGIRVGTVTIAGEGAVGTPFAPEKVAKAFLALHNTPPDAATAEIVFRG